MQKHAGQGCWEVIDQRRETSETNLCLIGPPGCESPECIMIVKISKKASSGA